MSTPTLKSEFNRADPNNLPDLFRKAVIGDVLARLAGDVAVEETVTVTSDVGVLSKRALAVLAVAATTGGVTGGITLVPPSVTPATHQAKMATDRKTITFLGADAVTAAKVLYIPAPDSLETLLAANWP